MKFTKYFFIVVFLILPFLVKAQETLPIYSDYLSDNVYLVHPSAAGLTDCSRIRLTARSQWNGISDAPSLQTLSYNSQIGEKGGLGFILFNDKNGYHSQQGIQGTYAYHIDLGHMRDYSKLCNSSPLDNAGKSLKETGTNHIFLMY